MAYILYLIMYKTAVRGRRVGRNPPPPPQPWRFSTRPPAPTRRQYWAMHLFFLISFWNFSHDTTPKHTQAHKHTHAHTHTQTHANTRTLTAADRFKRTWRQKRPITLSKETYYSVKRHTHTHTLTAADRFSVLEREFRKHEPIEDFAWKLKIKKISIKNQILEREFREHEHIRMLPEN